MCCNKKASCGPHSISSHAGLESCARHECYACVWERGAMFVCGVVSIRLL